MQTNHNCDPQQQIYSVQTEHMCFEITWKLWACSVLEYHLSKHLYIEQLCSQRTLHKHVRCKNLVLSEDSSPWIIILSWQQKSMWYQKDFGSNNLSPGEKKTLQSKWSWVRCFKGSIEQECTSSAETVQMLILPLQTHTQGIILLYPTTMRLTSLLMWFLHFLLCISVKLVLAIKPAATWLETFWPLELISSSWTPFVVCNCFIAQNFQLLVSNRDQISGTHTKTWDGRMCLGDEDCRYNRWRQYAGICIELSDGFTT